MSDTEGEIRVDLLTSLICEDDVPAALVSVMSANNETGVLHPIDRVASICRDAGVPLHVDATQSIGKLPVSLDSWGASAVTFSAHKFHGPTGIGGLWLDSGVQVRPILYGGEQQLESRPGTESVALVVGMAQSLRYAIDEMHESASRMSELRDRLEQSLVSRFPEIVIHGKNKPRLPGTSCPVFCGDRPPIDADGPRYGRDRLQQWLSLQQRKQSSQPCAAGDETTQRAGRVRPAFWGLKVFHR